MDAAAPTSEAWPRPFVWLKQFLKDELTPYPGRGALVARMVIAATIVMLISMTFKIPFAIQAVFAIIIAREDSRATLKAARLSIPAWFFAAAYIIIGAMVFVADPALRFLWILVSLFLSFFAISTISDYATASGFGVMIGLTIPLWGQEISMEQKVENTLWAAGQTAIAATTAVVVAYLFDIWKPGAGLMQSLSTRLSALEDLFQSYADGPSGNQRASGAVTHLAMLGTSMMRRYIRRSGYPQAYAEQMGVVVAFVGRLVDISASQTNLQLNLADNERERFRRLALALAGIHAAILEKRAPPSFTPAPESGDLVVTPLLPEMEKTISSIIEALSGSLSPHRLIPQADGGEPPQQLFIHDAFTNPEHVKFALKGTLAAGLCYVIYNAVDWFDISTSVVTCILTALTTIGASRQKQFLRFTGAIAGGAIAILAQVFILPNVTIGGFTLLFVAVTLVSTWFATASPRLSYFGIQIAVAYYFINIQEFKINTSLYPARDRVLGILLGLVMMWLIFDQLWSAPAAVSMRKTLRSILQSLAEFAREPLSPDLKTALPRTLSIRETINSRFDAMRSLTDSVLFEFGPSRERVLAIRDHIVHYQPQLRMLFITRIALLKYRLKQPGFILPEPVQLAQQDFDQHLAAVLDGMADLLKGGTDTGQMEKLKTSLADLEQTVARFALDQPPETGDASLQTFLALSRRIVELVAALRSKLVEVLPHPASGDNPGTALVPART